MPLLAKSYWQTTNLHGLKFLQIFSKKEKRTLAVTIVLVLAALGLSSYFTQMIILAGLFFIVALGVWVYLWRKACKDRLMKFYYLLKETDDVYLWVEKWDLKSKYIYSVPDFYWYEKDSLIRVYDYINTYDDKNWETAEPPSMLSKMPIPFRPFDEQIGSVTSIDLARTQEQSAAERLFTSLRKSWSEIVKLGFYIVVIIALIVGIIALVGG